MKTSSSSEIKKELLASDKNRIVELCLKLAKYKKENKELLSYLLFEADDEKKYIAGCKSEIDELFAAMNTSTMYLIRKSVRKILKLTNKYIKYSGLLQTELELRIYFCLRFKESGIQLHKSESLVNLYSNQVAKINTTLNKLHEDLQFDYAKEIQELSLVSSELVSRKEDSIFHKIKKKLF